MTYKVKMNENIIFEQENTNAMRYEDLKVYVGNNYDPVDGNIRYLTVETIDTCEAGWTYFSNICYKYIEEELTWQEAQDHCRDLTNNKVFIKQN